MGLQKDLNTKQLPRLIESRKHPLTFAMWNVNLNLGLSVKQGKYWWVFNFIMVPPHLIIDYEKHLS